MESQVKSAGVFLDRDGTLIREVGYLRRLEQMEILPRVPEALRLLREIGLKLVVITNQSAVARGFLTEAGLSAIHEELRKRLAHHGAFLDGLYYCPHHPTEGSGAYGVSCDCRKPNIGLIHRAADDLGLDPARSYVVGDQVTDMELAARAGARGVWIRRQEASASERSPACRVARDLWEAAQWIVGDCRGKG